MKRSLSFVTAISLVCASACTKDTPPAATKADAKATPTAPADPTAPATSPTVPNTETPAPTSPPTLAASYAAALDPLLDLVPADAPQFFVVRDLNEILDDSTWMLDAVRKPLLRAMELDDSPDPKAQRVVRDFTALRGKFSTSGIDFDRGMVVVGNDEGSDVIVFASANPEALNELLTTLGDGAPSKMKCGAIADAPGFAACAEKDDGTLAKYKPAKTAAAWRTELGTALPGVALEQANMLGRWRERDGDGANGLAISTAPGLMEIHVATKLDDEFESFAATGPAPALALAPKGSSFVWGRFAPAFVAAKKGDAPAFIGNVADTLTGEYFLGSLTDPAALVAIVGVTDAGPGAALVPMFSLVQDQVPKTLPDGTALAMKVESVDPGTGTGVQTVHAVGTGPRAALFAKLGLAQEGVAFVAGKYGAVAFGAGTDVVKRIATFEAAAGEAPIAHVLPTGLATALRDGKAVLAVHLELDGMQNQVLHDAFAQVLAEIPGAAAQKPAPSEVLDVALGIMSPLSSASLWITRDGGPSVVHVAIRSFGDPASEEGKAAHAALVEINAGTRPASTVYTELAGRFASSPRAFAYTARAQGSVAAVAPALGGAMLAGTMFFLLLGRKDEASVSSSASAVEIAPPPPAIPSR